MDYLCAKFADFSLSRFGTVGASNKIKHFINNSIQKVS